MDEMKGIGRFQMSAVRTEGTEMEAAETYLYVIDTATGDIYSAKPDFGGLQYITSVPIDVGVDRT